MPDISDMVLLARMQFAFTVAFHIIFPSFTIGLASYLAVVEGLWLKTGQNKYLELYRYWIKIFAISFGMGVVSGVVLSYQIGTNWSEFSAKVGNVLGPLLGYEVMTAFFLEASFLAIMLFGWNKVGRKLHFFSTCMVAIGTVISAFWILSANSWMHTPAGYEIRDGVFYATDWLKVIFNPSFPYRFSHMLTGAYLTTGLVVTSVAAFLMLRNKQNDAVKTMFKMGVVFVAIVAPLQLFFGHEHGINTREEQPVKLAAMEGHWETHKGAPFVAFAIPDQEQEKNHFEIAIPKLASLVVTHSLDGEIKGLKEWPKNERPPVAIVFWSFRLMVGLGLLMIALGFVGVFLLIKKQLFSNKYYLRAAVAMGPSGFFAVILGWIVAEVGRQPYTVYGLLRTADSASPITAQSVGMSLTIFIFVYGIVFTCGVFYIFKTAWAGPQAIEEKSADQIPTLSGRHVESLTSESGGVK